jgi:hypothetical protein
MHPLSPEARIIGRRPLAQIHLKVFVSIEKKKSIRRQNCDGLGVAFAK